MRRLNIRQGATGGFVVATINAAGAAGRSADPLTTFAVFFGAAMIPVALALYAGVLINRNSKGPDPRW